MTCWIYGNWPAVACCRVSMLALYYLLHLRHSPDMRGITSSKYRESTMNQWRSQRTLLFQNMTKIIEFEIKSLTYIYFTSISIFSCRAPSALHIVPFGVDYGNHAILRSCMYKHSCRVFEYVFQILIALFTRNFGRIVWPLSHLGPIY